MSPFPVLLGLSFATAADAGMWCETNIQGLRLVGSEIHPGEPIGADSWDACTDECRKEPTCAFIDYNTDTQECYPKSAMGGYSTQYGAWLCGHCYRGSDPPPVVPHSQCKHKDNSCSMTDLCCATTGSTLACDMAHGSGGTCVAVSDALLHGVTGSFIASAVFLSIAAAYLLLGTLYGLASGERGSRILPNATFWATVGGLVRDGISFSVSRGKPAPERLLAPVPSPPKEQRNRTGDTAPPQQAIMTGKPPQTAKEGVPGGKAGRGGRHLPLHYAASQGAAETLAGEWAFPTTCRHPACHTHIM